MQNKANAASGEQSVKKGKCIVFKGCQYHNIIALLEINFLQYLIQGFFRRSIVKVEKKNEKYACVKGDENCKLGTGKRTMCSYCRYKKCLEVGMSHGGKNT